MTRAAAPRVVVSVLNWNTPALTLRCLRALAGSDYVRAEVVVVDNASTDASVARIARAWPQLRLLRAESNLGYAGGHALALDYAVRSGADALCLLNSDAEPEAGAIAALVAAWQQHGDALYGALPLSHARDGRRVMSFPDKYLDPQGRPRPFRRDREVACGADWDTLPPRRVGAVTGSCLLLPLRVVAAQGWMDTAWFLYCEEIDYAYRLRAAGVPALLVPAARCWHAGGGSARTGRVADVVAYYRARNEIGLARRHGAAGVGAIVALKKLLRALALAPWRPRRALAVLRGCIDALRGRYGRRLSPEPLRMAPRPPGTLRLAFWRLKYRLDLLRRRWLAPRPVCRCDEIGAATGIATATPPPYLEAYQAYCVGLLREALHAQPRALQIAFGGATPATTANGRLCRVDIQWEHTLVAPGGRDSADAVAGTVPLMDGTGCYQVRVARLAELQQQDLVIDYSQPNRINLERSGQHAALLQRLIVIAPLLHRFDPSPDHRPHALICLFGDPRQPRRADLLAAARRRGLPLRQIGGVFATPALQALYRASRVLLNVHQTAQHHTFEELRVLPALQSGMVVVSEDVPLRETIPYHDFVIWARYEDLLDTAARVLEDYAAVHARVFGDGRLERVLERMGEDNRAATAAALTRLATGSDAP